MLVSRKASMMLPADASVSFPSRRALASSQMVPCNFQTVGPAHPHGFSVIRDRDSAGQFGRGEYARFSLVSIRGADTPYPRGETLELLEGVESCYAEPIRVEDTAEGRIFRQPHVVSLRALHEL